MNDELDSKLLLYINKIKKANNTDKRNNLSDINKYLKKNISERQYDDYILSRSNNYYKILHKINNITNYYNINKENKYQNLNHKIRFDDIIKITTPSNKRRNFFRNNKFNIDKNIYGKTLRSMDFYLSGLNDANSKLSRNNNYFTIKKENIEKMFNFL